MAMFSALDSADGMAKLNDFLASRSFVKEYAASQADLAVLAALTGVPDGAAYPHVLRWFNTVVAIPAAQAAALPGSADGVVDKTPTAAAAAPAESAPAPAEDDDDFDPFADDDDEDDEAYKAQQARAEAALKAKEIRDAEKKAKGKETVAKTSVVFDIKPWDDETDMKALEAGVRGININGLHWGAAKLAPIGYGINKLQIMSTIIDDLVPSTEEVSEQIEDLEDFVQSVDIASFQKI